jgi:hypothetical protein
MRSRIRLSPRKKIREMKINVAGGGSATDPAAHLSPTPPTPIGDVDGVADRPRILSLA